MSRKEAQEGQKTGRDLFVPVVLFCGICKTFATKGEST